MALKIDETFEGKATLIDIGESPDDKRGDVAQIFCAKYNGTIRALMYFLTGGAKLEGKLDKPLPVHSGGTGSNTIAGMMNNMGLVVGYNGKIHKGSHQVKLWNDRVTYNGKTDPDVYIEKQGTGIYLVKGITRIPNAALNGSEYAMIHPESATGILTHLVMPVEVNEQGMLVHVYSYDHINDIPKALEDLPSYAYGIINAAKV